MTQMGDGPLENTICFCFVMYVLADMHVGDVA